MASGHDKFHHPYQPYDIQLEFMNALYECIDQGQVGIFESPTGLSAVDRLGKEDVAEACSRNDHQQDDLGSDALEDADEPEWVLEYARTEKRNALLAGKREFEARLAKIRAKELRQKEKYENGEPRQKRIKINAGSDLKTSNLDDDQFLLDDYESDDNSEHGQRAHQAGENGLSATTVDLLTKLGMISTSSKDEPLEFEDRIKVLYCSRTHSQLIQFANELRRVNITPKSIHGGDDNAINETEQEDAVAEGIKHLSLGSRKNLCINPAVSKLGSATAVNERCLELQQSRSKASEGAKCSFLPTKENEPLVHDFRDHTLAAVRDIEDLGAIGKKIGICPYYASRATIKPSEIVTLPYPLLLQKSAREALELSLKDHVVIIDEAHNLMDAISNIYSSTVSLSQLKRARAQLTIYLQKFRNKLKGKNRVYVAQIVRLIDSLASFLETSTANTKKPDGIVNVSELMAGKGVDQINLFKLSRYLQESKLARKVDGYIIHNTEEATVEKTKNEPSVPTLTHVGRFFLCLTYPTAEGRFFYSKTEDNETSLKYLLLDPMHQFREIVDNARAVILAGGTMSPMNDYINHLLPYLPPSKIRTLSCGHVIPKENLLAWPITTGPNGMDFEFTYEKRNQPTTIDELGNCILQLAKCIPDGIVIFFPSYSYLEQVITRWKRTASTNQTTLWTSLSSIKPIFLENKETSSVDSVLTSYTNSTNTGKGAILLSVVGGKMSEGINFSDKLARGVLIVGLPFPNAQTAEWKAKLEYIEGKTISQGGSKAEGKIAAKEFYENSCMRAVNQCIGRAIRHKGDYAFIGLVDRRYNTERIQSKLPKWIRSGLPESGKEKRTVGEVIKSVTGFFEVVR